MTRFKAEQVAVTLGDRIVVDWLNTPVTVRAVVTLTGSGGRYVVYFLTDDSAVPPPFYSEGERTCGVFLPFHEFDGFMNLVRNQENLFIHLDQERPEQSRVGTEVDPFLELAFASGPSSVHQGRSVAKAVGSV